MATYEVNISYEFRVLVKAAHNEEAETEALRLTRNVKPTTTDIRSAVTQQELPEPGDGKTIELLTDKGWVDITDGWSPDKPGSYWQE